MEPPRPSAYTPISRWFTDERERELEETRALYRSVKTGEASFVETVETIARRAYMAYRPLAPAVDRPLLNALCWVIEAERYLTPVPDPRFDRMNLQEYVEYRNLLYAKQYFLQNEKPLLDLLHEGLERVFANVADLVPDCDEASPFTIPLVYTLPNPGEVIDRIYGTLLADEYQSRGIFKAIGQQLYENLCRVSGREPGDDSRKTWKHASDCNFPLEHLADAYLKNTPFEALFNAPVPLRLTRDDRMSHMHVCGGSGSGKTSLLEHLIVHDLRSPDPPSLIVIDPHSDLIRRLARADLGIEDRLVIIDPRDIEHPPALNVFAVNQDRFRGYDAATREQITAGVIQTFEYLFSGFGIDLTGKQQVLFRNVARVMLLVREARGRNATILDMLELLNDPAPYGDVIQRLPPIPRDFYVRDFLSQTFRQTREQIRYRLQAILENPTLARLFTSSETKVDLFMEINRGSVILVDTAKDFLKDGSSIFGRIFISLVLQAVLERSAIPAHLRKDTFLIVDEAASYFDDNIDDFLTEARKYRAGVVLSHQFLDQASYALRSSLAANTAIKFAAGLSSSDARSMAPEMRTTADFILDQPRLQFAAYFRNITPHAVSIPVRPGLLDGAPRLSEAAQQRTIERNRARVSMGPHDEAAPPTAKARAQSPEEASPPFTVPRSEFETRPAVSNSPASPHEDISSTW